jgi:hypothetical protein
MLLILPNKQTILLRILPQDFTLYRDGLNCDIFEHAFEIYAGAIAIILQRLNMVRNQTAKKTIIIEKVLIPESIFETERERIGI